LTDFDKKTIDNVLTDPKQIRINDG